MDPREVLPPRIRTPLLRTCAPARRARGQRGLALVMVLWMLAALLVAATGVVHAVRSEVRTVNAQRELSGAAALGEAGLVLALRALTEEGKRGSAGSGLRRYEIDFEHVAIGLQVVPLTGLVDLNAAGEPLLIELIAVGADVDRNRASSLAQRIIDWRDADVQAQSAGAEDPTYAAEGSPFRTRGGPFEVAEDLLQVIGFDFDLCERLRPLVTVHARGDGRVDPGAAPLAVLRVLAAGNDQIASEYAAAREASGVLADTTRFPAAFIAERQAPSRFLLRASVPLSNGAFAVVRRIVEVGAAREGLAWQTLWVERSVEAELMD